MKNFQLNKFQIVLLVLGLTAIFLLIYSPSFTVPFPGHPDEWHHISQALNLQQGEYQWRGLPTFGFGFHLFLYGINQLADLIQVYQFLAPTWAVLSALVLFFVTYSLSGQNFLTAFSSIFFFGSIKSALHLLGIHFFTPLSFAIPFIFLYIFFFVRGLEKENKRYLFLSLLIMLFLVFTHAISVTFAFPVLIFSCIIYYGYIRKELRFFLLFLLIPLAGLFFYRFVNNIAPIDSVKILIKDINLWGELERASVYSDSLIGIYSTTGVIMAGIGFLAILWKKKKYLYPYIAWPLCLILMILIFRMTDISFLSPYRRNFYYLVISLPLLSAFGLSWIIEFLAGRFKRMNFNLMALTVLLATIFFSFASYNKNSFIQSPYIKTITVDDYQDLLFLAEFPKARVLAPPLLIKAVPSVTGHTTVGDFDYLNAYFTFKHVQEFFENSDCNFKDAVLEAYNIDYIISENEIFCDYKLLRSEHNYIYQVSD